MTPAPLPPPDLDAWRRLARSFPSFARYPDHVLTPSAINTAYPALSPVAKHAASFLVDVWNGNAPETYVDATGRKRRRPVRPYVNVRTFALSRAVAAWDRGHLRAFQDWAAGNARPSPDSSTVYPGAVAPCLTFSATP